MKTTSNEQTEAAEIMSELVIKTNNIPRDVIFGYELTEIERKEFDYHDFEADNPSFFRFKGQLYDLGEFMRISEHAIQMQEPLAAWDGFVSNSFFSGVVVRYVENCERVIVGSYYC